MPVNLDVIPDAVPKISRPRTVRWCIFWVFLLLAGAAVTLWFWKREHSGMAFWFAALGLPTAIWGTLFSLRRIGYKCDQIWAEAWNKERITLLEEETLRGQRKLWVYGSAAETAIGNKRDTMISACTAHAPLMSSTLPRMSRHVLRHTHLGSESESIQTLLNINLIFLADRMNILLDALPASMPCYVLFDACLDDDPALSQKIAAEYSKLSSRPLRQITDSGFSALDKWVDMTWGVPSVLLVISAQYYENPKAGSGEAVTALLLGNGTPQDNPQAVRAHRPESGTPAEAGKTLSRALLWANIPAASIAKAWLTGESVLIDGGWSDACGQNGIKLDTQTQCPVIDDIVGFTGCTAPWLALITASVQCSEDGKTQAVAVKTATDEVWMGCVTAPTSDVKDNQDTLQ